MLTLPVIRPRSRVELYKEPQYVELKPRRRPDTLLGVLTAMLVTLVLIAAPLVLGAARLWYELPLLGVVALILTMQGFRLASKPSESAARRIDLIDVTVFLFVLYVVARWLTSPTEYFSRLEVLNVVAYAGIFLVCRYGLARRTYALTLLGLLVVLGVFETGFGYYLSQNLDWCPFGPNEVLHQGYAPRWVGTYGCPNNYSCLLVMAVGTALAFACFSKLSWPLRIFLFYLAMIMMVGVLNSGSRGSWLGSMAMMIALTIFGVRYGMVRLWVPLTGGLVLILALVLTFSQSHLVRERLMEVESSQVETLSRYCRIQLTFDALRIAQDHLYWGTGPATFVFIHQRYQSNTYPTKAIFTHDDYLNCLADYGLVGFGLAMVFIWAVSFQFLGQLRADSRWHDRVTTAASFMAWCAVLIHSFVDFNMHIPANALMLLGLVGLGLRRIPRHDEEPARGSFSLAPLGRGLGAVVLVIAVAYGALVWRTASSDLIYETAASDPIPTMRSIPIVEKALKYDAGNAQAWALLGDLHRFRASRQDELEDRIVEGQQALDAYQKAQDASPLDDSIMARRGLTYDMMRRYAEAYLCFKEAVTQEPYNGQFWYHLGNHFWQCGMLEKAEQSYLLGAQCPHGAEGNAESAAEVREILDAGGVAKPEPGASPLVAQPPPTEEPGSTP